MTSGGGKRELQRMSTKEMAEYNEMDMDELLAQLSTDEINLLSREVDPDVSNSPQIRIAKIRPEIYSPLFSIDAQHHYECIPLKN
jgi:Tropomodulin